MLRKKTSGKPANPGSPGKWPFSPGKLLMFPFSALMLLAMGQQGHRLNEERKYYQHSETLSLKTHSMYPPPRLQLDTLVPEQYFYYYYYYIRLTAFFPGQPG